MTKLFKKKVSLSASIGVIAIVSVLAVGSYVMAYQNDNIAPQNVFESGSNVTINQDAAVPPSDEVLGGVNPDIPYDFLVVNNDMTKYISGSFINASTTIVSVLNPFGTTSTSTISFMQLIETGVATSTYSIACGAATTAYATPTYNIIESGSIATSTSFGTIENNLTAALNGNSVGVTGGTAAKISLTPTYPYLVCKVTIVPATLYTGAFTEVTNTFDGKFEFRANRLRF